MADNQQLAAALSGTIKPTPRNPVLGGVADLLGMAYKLPEMPRMGVPGIDFLAANRKKVLDLLQMGDVQKTADALSYSNAIGTGKGMTYRPKDETINAALAVAPMVAPAVRAGVAGAKTLGPTAANMAEDLLLRQGLMMGILPPSKYFGKTLEGMPDVVNVGGKMEQFGTDQRLVDIAKSYVADKGLVYSPQTKYATIDENRATRLAQAYEGMANNPNDPKVKKAYNAMIEETMAQYEALRKKGYKFDFMPESGDIYGNPRNAINDIVQNKRLSIFPTEQGFGGPSAAVASEANPLLIRTGETWNGKPVTANDVFRAVHDVFGHGKHGVGFRAAGEENAFQSHARMYSPEALPAATSETRGQNSWVNYGPFGESNKTASPILTEYAEQKTGLMPAWTWREGFLK